MSLHASPWSGRETSSSVLCHYMQALGLGMRLALVSHVNACKPGPWSGHETSSSVSIMSLHASPWSGREASSSVSCHCMQALGLGMRLALVSHVNACKPGPWSGHETSSSVSIMSLHASPWSGREASSSVSCPCSDIPCHETSLSVSCPHLARVRSVDFNSFRTSNSH